MPNAEPSQSGADPHSDTAYLICERCAWVLPIMHTDENERCPECEGRFVVVDDHVLPEVSR